MLSLLYVLRFGNYPSRQMKLQQIRGARIRKLKKVVKDFIVMSTRKNNVHEGVSITHTILFAYSITSKGLHNCGCNLLQKKTQRLTVIADGFPKINPHL